MQQLKSFMPADFRLCFQCGKYKYERRFEDGEEDEEDTSDYIYNWETRRKEYGYSFSKDFLPLLMGKTSQEA